MRRRMEQHRSQPSCAVCHNRLDPLGFGLENYDGLGAWRDKDAGHVVDASGTLPSGESFRGPGELKAILKSRPREFARCLTEKMLTYALGRGLEESDRLRRRPDRQGPRGQPVSFLGAGPRDRPERSVPQATVWTVPLEPEETRDETIGPALASHPVARDGDRPGPALAGGDGARRLARGRGRARRQIPRRMAFLYVPNGVHMADWTPAETGALAGLPPTLQPLEPFRQELLVLSGLAQQNAAAMGDEGGDHARSLACFLTGTHPLKTDGANIRAGVSIDQVAAFQIGHQTRLPSLELGIDPSAQAGSCDSGYSCAYSSNISWRSANLPMAKEIDPRLVFDRLFGSRMADLAPGERVRRERYEKSILDFVLEDARQLQTQLGINDRRKIEEYLSAVREIERRIAQFRIGRCRHPAGAWSGPARRHPDRPARAHPPDARPPGLWPSRRT